MPKPGSSSCELCTNPARMFCESDQARLCWDCDEKVHSANFLVAKHSRTLLCHVCYSHTAWKASGLKLGHTVCVCHACAEVGVGRTPPICENSQESETDDGEFYDSESDDEEMIQEEDEEDDGENQVVPWAEAAVCCSDDEEEEDDDEEDEDLSLKRIRSDPCQSEDEDDGCCSSENSDDKLRAESNQISYHHQLRSDDNSDSSLSTSLVRPLKIRRTGDFSPLISHEQADMKSLTGTAAIVDKLRRLQEEMVAGEGAGGEASAAMILRVCKLTRE